MHSSIGKAPFEVIEGRPKLPLMLKPHDKIFAADEYVRDISVAFDKIKDAISKAQEKHKKRRTSIEGLWLSKKMIGFWQGSQRPGLVILLARTNKGNPLGTKDIT